MKGFNVFMGENRVDTQVATYIVHRFHYTVKMAKN